MRDMNLDELFQQTARRQPEQPAIIDARAGIRTYRELTEEIDRAASELRRAGVSAGDCVGLHCASGANYIVLNYAIWRCGGCVVPVPMELAPDEKAEIARQIALDYVVSPKAQATQLAAVTHDDQTELSAGFVLAPALRLCNRPAGFAEINAAFIRFTSGTTGASKGVVLSHETIFDRITAANGVLMLGPPDRVAWLLSMSYHFAVSIVAYLNFGAAIILPENHLAPAVVDAVDRYQATIMYASPMHYTLIAGYQGTVPLTSLRLALSTTSSLTAATARQFRERCGISLSQALGIIEVGLPCINTEHAAEKPESVGRVLPAYELRLDDAGFGDLKQLAFRGPGLLDAYYHPWRRREELMVEGWFRTGDVGEVDADGCIHLRGRSSDVINSAGMKFFPQEVEKVLVSHPLVAEACVFARDHERFGEIPCARVRLEGTVDKSNAENVPNKLRRYCEQHLASYKVPLEIEVVRRLPRTGSGKVLRRDLVKS
jgi:long-chain acyl-CoA synthetase